MKKDQIVVMQALEQVNRRHPMGGLCGLMPLLKEEEFITSLIHITPEEYWLEVLQSYFYDCDTPSSFAKRLVYIGALPKDSPELEALLGRRL